MKLATYNCKNFKSNTKMICELINTNDICFFIEHWLAEEEAYLFNELNSTKSILFESEFSLSENRRGRPFGGKCWVIDERFNVLSYETISGCVSRVVISGRDGFKCVIYGVWIPFDDNTPERLSIIQSTLSLLESELCVNNENNVMIIGDFNCDLSRGKRFDRLLARFIVENDLSDAISLFDQKCDHTYSNNVYKATIDHIIVNSDARLMIEECRIIDNALCLSDHRAIVCSIRSISGVSDGSYTDNNVVMSDTILEKSLHKFPWANELFLDSYTNILDKCLSEFIEDLFNLALNQIDFIDQVCEMLPKIMIKVARDAEKSCGLSTSNSVRRNQKVVNLGNEADYFISEIKRIVMLNDDTRTRNSDRLKLLRRELRRIQRKATFNNVSNRALRLESMLRLDKGEFWRRISAFRRKNKKRASVTNKQPTARDFIDFYSDLFSHNDRVSSSEHIVIEEEVKKHFNELKDINYDVRVSEESIMDSISELKSHKACGVDGICNEMLKCGGNPPRSLVYLLKVFYSSILNTGHIPSGLCVSLLKPIPKKGTMNGPSDYRPISISSVLATIFETVLLERMSFIRETSATQFGYKANTSCKSTFFVVNEVMQYYQAGHSPLHIVALDAKKAFDKLWREGLFFKLINKADNIVWRALYAYYSQSSIIVSVDKCRSQEFRTTQGVKQGGKLSPYLFNYFIDGLIQENNALNVGALIGEFNLSTIGYCDDLALLSPLASHMQLLLDNAARYAAKWKMEFNSQKSSAYSVNRNFSHDFYLGGLSVPKCESLIYLGLPIGSDSFVGEFFDAKMRRTEKSLYSLYGLGCNKSGLNPRRTAFIYKQYCQSIVKYGLENLYLSNSRLRLLNIRQNVLVKSVLGLSPYCRTKPLFQALRIEQFTQLYSKHKVFFIKQIESNMLTRGLFAYLNDYYLTRSPTRYSFICQLRQVEELTSILTCILNYKQLLDAIDTKFANNDIELAETIKEILDSYNVVNFFKYVKLLNDTLKIDFRNVTVS